MLNGEKKIKRPFRWAMIGGGRTSQVGYKHRSGALRDNTAFQLVAGAFDVDTQRGLDFGTNLGVAADRCYPDYKTMFTAESKRSDGIEAVSIATPNGSHYEICKAALEAGLHVVCEKPLFFEVAQVEEIKRLAEQKKKIVGVTYGFSGYQMLLQARHMIENGDIGDVRMVNLRYTHGFSSSEDAEKYSDSQKWRVNPKISGSTFVIGDLSTHTYYMSQLMVPKIHIKKILCDRQSFIPSRAPLEDNAYILMHYDNGAVGSAWTSSVDAGHMDSQTIRITGSKASIEFTDINPTQLLYEVQGKPNQILYRGMDYLDETALYDERLGPLHVEGLCDAWANIYLKFAVAMKAKDEGREDFLKNLVFPDINAGLEGVRWITNCVRSSDQGSIWVDFK